MRKLFDDTILAVKDAKKLNSLTDEGYEIMQIETADLYVDNRPVYLVELRPPKEVDKENQ